MKTDTLPYSFNQALKQREDSLLYANPTEMRPRRRSSRSKAYLAMHWRDLWMRWENYLKHEGGYIQGVGGGLRRPG